MLLLYLLVFRILWKTE